MGKQIQPAGWIPDQADPRDYTLQHSHLLQLLLQSQAHLHLTQVTQQLVRGLTDIVSNLSQIQVPGIEIPLPFGGPIKLDPFTVPGLSQEVQTDIQQTLAGIDRLSPATPTAMLNMLPATLGKGTDKTIIQLDSIQTNTNPSPDSPRSPSIARNTTRLFLPVRGNLQQLEQCLQPDRSTWELPNQMLELKSLCRRIEDQTRHGYNACSAHAGVALMEYFATRYGTQQNSGPDDTRFSSRFLYHVTRALKHQGSVDSGTSLRDTLKAMMIFGLPPEDYWPWQTGSAGQPPASPVDDNLVTAPSAFCYAYAQNYQTLRYFRLDRPGITPATLLAQIKVALLGGFPAVFGFRIFQENLYDLSRATGDIPLPPSIPDLPPGTTPNGHAALAIGYDDTHHIPGHSPGALYFKNSWGEDWGDRGFGWLPYDYLLKATKANLLSGDWWTLLDAQWMETNDLGIRPEEQVLILGEKPRPGDGSKKPGKSGK